MPACLLGLALLARSAPGQQPSQSANASLDSINHYIAAEMQRQRILGLSLAVLRGGRVGLRREAVHRSGGCHVVAAGAIPIGRSGHPMADGGLAGQGIAWLGAPIERACYTRATGKEHAIVTVCYTRDWQVAHLETSRY